MKKKLLYLFIVLKYYKLYREYKKRLSGKEIIDFTQKAGYFFHVGLFNDPKKEPHKVKMQSGQTAICKLLSYKCYRDPNDMIEYANYQFLGYEGLKLIPDCTFIEYLSIYCL